MNFFPGKFRFRVAAAALAFTVSLFASPLPMAFRLPSNDLYRYDILSGPPERTVVAFESPVPCGTGCPSMPVSLRSGCRYSFSALVNAEISGGVVQLMLEWRDAKGHRLGSAYGGPSSRMAPVRRRDGGDSSGNLFGGNVLLRVGGGERQSPV